ncbi:hypothetical protein M0L20_10985 [Spirosoma sp. RP8]|uniref:Uncharacterized protein n=1 Tax=Spirosoma liriopis TaxID=2937440 RepID=A0ABT0HJN4_9BACT|nr:hypothetical protein [Spirosoma liriopis]MCK8492376.1 hypothetical protein [Spirosoma liriopis]
MIILKGIGFALLGIGLFLLATYVVMRLWNWLVPSLFNGPRLRFVQALGLFFLARLLFGFGFGRFGHYSYGRPYWHHGRHHHDGHKPNGQQPHNQLKPVVPAPVPEQ